MMDTFGIDATASLCLFSFFSVVVEWSGGGSSSEEVWIYTSDTWYYKIVRNTDK